MEIINDTNCIFCSIVNNQKDNFVIDEDENTLCFLDKRPLFLGHSLLIPKSHLSTLQDIPSKIIHTIFEKTKLIAKAVEKGTQAQGSFIAMNNVVSQSVPHFHVHIVPRTKGDGLKGFFWPRTNYASVEEKIKIQQQIISALHN